MADGLAVTGLAGVKEMLREPNRFSAKMVFDGVESGFPLIPLGYDPPEQTRYRRILQPFFSPRRIRPLEESLRAQAVDLIEGVKARGGCEFVADIADPFPAQGLLTLLGLPLEEREQFIACKTAALALTADAAGEVPLTDEERVTATERTAATAGYLMELIQTRRARPGDDILSEILAIDGDDRLSDAEAMGLCVMLIMAGLETVTDALSMAMERLATAPERRKELVAAPSLVPAAVEELLRLDPRAPFLPRVTTEDVEVAGCPVSAGTLVNAHLTTANRDEATCPPRHRLPPPGERAHRLRRRRAPLPGRAPGAPGDADPLRGVALPDPGVRDRRGHRARLVRANIGLESPYLCFPGTGSGS